MTIFENETLKTLLHMKSKELQESTNKDVRNLAEQCLNIAMAINVIESMK